MCIFLEFLFFFAELFPLGAHEDDRDDKRDAVSTRSGNNNAVQSEEQRNDDDCGNEDDDLTEAGEDRCLDGLADCLEEDRRTGHDTVEDQRQHEDAQTFCCKFVVKLGFRTEQIDDLLREALKRDRSDRHHHRRNAGRHEERLFNTRDIAGAVVVADDRLRAHVHAHRKRDDDLTEFRADTDGCERDLGAVFGKCAVMYIRAVEKTDEEKHRDL